MYVDNEEEQEEEEAGREWMRCWTVRDRACITSNPIKAGKEI
jgi:hypothetical protein